MLPFSMMPLLWEERHDASCSAGRPAGQVCVDNWVGRSSLMTICHDASQLGCYVVSFCPGNSATSIMGDVNFANWFLTWMRRLADKHCGTPELLFYDGLHYFSVKTTLASLTVADVPSFWSVMMYCEKKNQWICLIQERLDGHNLLASLEKD